jgi:hypothetical protein
MRVHTLLYAGANALVFGCLLALCELLAGRAARALALLDFPLLALLDFPLLAFLVLLQVLGWTAQLTLEDMCADL